MGPSGHRRAGCDTCRPVARIARSCPPQIVEPIAAASCSAGSPGSDHFLDPQPLRPQARDTSTRGLSPPIGSSAGKRLRREQSARNKASARPPARPRLPLEPAAIRGLTTLSPGRRDLPWASRSGVVASSRKAPAVEHGQRQEPATRIRIDFIRKDEGGNGILEFGFHILDYGRGKLRLRFRLQKFHDPGFPYSRRGQCEGLLLATDGK